MSHHVLAMMPLHVYRIVIFIDALYSLAPAHVSRFDFVDPEFAVKLESVLHLTFVVHDGRSCLMVANKLDYLGYCVRTQLFNVEVVIWGSEFE